MQAHGSITSGTVTRLAVEGPYSGCCVNAQHRELSDLLRHVTTFRHIGPGEKIVSLERPRRSAELEVQQDHTGPGDTTNAFRWAAVNRNIT